MPNGRYVSASVSEVALRQFLDSIHGNPVVGQIHGAEVALLDVKRLFVSGSGDEILVEGQHMEGGRAMVIHFPGDWLWVTESRPMFEGLEKLCLESLRLGKKE